MDAASLTYRGSRSEGVHAPTLHPRENGPARAAAAAAANAERANDEECPLYELMAVPDYKDVLCEQLDYVLLSRFRVSRAMRRWIDPIWRRLP